MVLWTEDNNFRTQSFHFDNFCHTKFWFENDLFSKNLRDFDRDFGLSRGKIWLWLFYKKKLRLGSTILHQKFQVIPSKIEGVTAIFPIFDVNFPDSNHRHAFIFARNDMKFFV